MSDYTNLEFQFLMKADYGTSVTMIKDIPKILMCNKDRKILYGFYRQILCMNKTLCIILLIIPFMQGIHIGPTTSLWLLRVLYSCCLCKNDIYVVCFQQTWMHHTYDENMIRPQRISWINLGICVNRIKNKNINFLKNTFSNLHLP